jgi:hypothetical protein
MNVDKDKSTVAVSRGASRYEAVKKALEFIRDDIARSIKGKRRVLIKPTSYQIVFNWPLPT